MLKKLYFYRKNYVQMHFGDITLFHTASIKSQVNVQNKYEMKMIGEFNDIHIYFKNKKNIMMDYIQFHSISILMIIND